MNYGKNLLAIAAAIILISSALVPVAFIQKAEAATINITTNTTWTNMTIGAADVVNIFSGATLIITGVVSNSGTINVNSGGVLGVGSTGTLNVNSGGTLNVNTDGAVGFSGTANVNSGGLLNIFGTVSVNTVLNLYGTLVIDSGGLLIINFGPLNLYGTLIILSGGTLGMNAGALNVKSGGAIVINIGGDLIIGSIGTLNINSGGEIIVGTGADLTLIGTLNVNSGGMLSVGPGTLNVNSGGKLNLYGKLLLQTGGTLSNSGTINKQCGGTFTQESGSTFTGNPIVALCVFPITHMSDTTASSGSKLFKGGNTISGERVTSTSQLKGDKIDQITIKLKKFGTPTGNAIIGVFSSTGALKKQFAAKDVATLTTGFKDYTFKLSGGQLYTIVSGDRIGIKYTGGSATNSISVMRDTNPADPFDGTKTDIQQFKAGVWSGINTNDMYMILKQTHG